jgi:hypothetical protein
MEEQPDWLPSIVCVSPWNDQTFNILYEIFERDFKQTKPVYRGGIVWFFPEMEDGKEKIFWHLTHKKDNKTGVRLPDLRRSERLPWVRKMIDHSYEPEVTAWDYKEGGKHGIKTYVWLKKYDFLVIMKKYPNGTRRLITSYYVDFPNTRRKLERKYSRRIN